MSIHSETSTAQPSSIKQKKAKALTISTLHQAVTKGQKITSLTCYDYTTSKILDETGVVDILLVGDSLAMTVLGHKNTLSVTMDEMLHHVKAVTRGCQRSLVVADMPFMSYQVSLPQTLHNAGRFMKEGHASAVKLEGASKPILEAVSQLTAIGIPVMGHLGLTPQSIHTIGGFKVQGKTRQDAEKLLNEALALEKAGAFSLVLEMVPVEVATLITERLSIPTIGIGAGNGCSGQILVIDDFLGLYQDLSPKFVRHYLQSDKQIQDAVQQYANDIQSGNFPNNTTEAFAFTEPDSLHSL